ncbi:hypothetical protein [Limnoglobus roseus]|uniref:Uncharacterized protein n=1 Tax=Limnoglobus roseus TaxID=2598579 RepID=A0A5C1AD23_9BACT|nr:hypothetical protein [Limnoglobus roseus]QEL14958.1 hypothetical protein PX52LOC_01861 [Limnoglobus roseus]
MVQLVNPSPILGRLPTIDQVYDRLEQTAAERRALRTLLRALKQANLVPGDQAVTQHTQSDALVATDAR